MPRRRATPWEAEIVECRCVERCRAFIQHDLRPGRHSLRRQSAAAPGGQGLDAGGVGAAGCMHAGAERHGPPIDDGGAHRQAGSDIRPPLVEAAAEQFGVGRGDSGGGRQFGRRGRHAVERSRPHRHDTSQRSEDAQIAAVLQRPVAGPPARRARHRFQRCDHVAGEPGVAAANRPLRGPEDVEVRARTDQPAGRVHAGQRVDLLGQPLAACRHLA